MTLGRYGDEVTLDQARKRAKRHLGEIVDGKDPLELREAADGRKTFDELREVYLKRHAAHKKTGQEDRRRLDQHIPRSWRNRPIQTIRRVQVSALHHKIGLQAPYEANRLLALLSVMFNLAPEFGVVDEGWPNPAKGIKRFKEKQRKRWLKPEELPALARAIDAEPNIYIRAALWLYLLTGLRKSELLELRWDDVDLERGEILLRDTKGGEEQTVPLSGAAIAIVQSIPKQEGHPYLLPGQRQGQHLVNITKSWIRIRKAAGCNDVRLHDLRRTTGSWLSQAGVDLNLVKEALRHKNINTTLIYARLGRDAARSAFEDHGRRVMEAAGRAEPAEVVTISGSRNTGS